MNRTKNAFGAVLFDLDGTLVDSRDDVAASVNVGLEHVGGAPKTTAEIASHIGEPLTDIFRAFLTETEPSDIDEACAAYRRHFFDNCACKSTLYLGVLECIEELAPRPLGVATSKATFQAVRVCEVFGIARFFRAIQGCDDIPHKPDPAVVLAALDRLGAAPKDAWMVGDTVFDIRAGRAAGCRTCAVTYGIGTREALAEEKPDLLLDGLAALPEILRG
jgi:phosphoglycolate phosphatase